MRKVSKDILHHNESSTEKTKIFYYAKSFLDDRPAPLAAGQLKRKKLQERLTVSIKIIYLKSKFKN